MRNAINTKAIVLALTGEWGPVPELRAAASGKLLGRGFIKAQLKQAGKTMGLAVELRHTGDWLEGKVTVTHLHIPLTAARQQPFWWDRLSVLKAGVDSPSGQVIHKQLELLRAEATNV